MYVAMYVARNDPPSSGCGLTSSRDPRTGIKPWAAQGNSFCSRPAPFRRVNAPAGPGIVIGTWMAAALSLALVSGYVQAGRGEMRLAVRERTCLRHRWVCLPARRKATPAMRGLSCRDAAAAQPARCCRPVKALVLRGRACPGCHERPLMTAGARALRGWAAPHHVRESRNWPQGAVPHTWSRPENRQGALSDLCGR
jgi:hypothetical protein